MTSRQAKHQAKQRAEGAIGISVTFRADEPEGDAWRRLSSCHGPKEAMRRLLSEAVASVARMKVYTNQGSMADDHN